MRKGFLVSLAGWLVGSSLVLGQSPNPAPSAPPPEPLPPLASDTTAAPKPFWESQNAGTGAPTLWSADLEYVLWFFASHGPPNTAASSDVLSSATAVVLGSNRDEPGRTGMTSGGRLTLGYWWTETNGFVPDHTIRDFGAEAILFGIGERSRTFNNGNRAELLRPFFDLNDRVESGVIVAAPGLASGTVSISTKAEMWGAETNVRKNIFYNFPGTTLVLDVLGGVRFLSLDQDLEFDRASIFQKNLTAFPTFQFLAGSRLTEQEFFTTHNRFYGGQFGGDAKFYYEKLGVDIGAKVALGVTTEDLAISGFQLKTAPNGVNTLSQGALLALPSNIGHYQRDKFTQIPDLSVRLGYPLLECLTVSLGFEAIYWNRLLRPGEQIDRQIDITQIPNFPVPAGTTPTGLNKPSVPFTQSEIWVLGITFGVELTW